MMQLWTTIPAQPTSSSESRESDIPTDVYVDEQVGSPLSDESQPSFAIAGIVIVVTVAMFFLALYVLSMP